MGLKEDPEKGWQARRLERVMQVGKAICERDRVFERKEESGNNCNLI